LRKAASVSLNIPTPAAAPPALSPTLAPVCDVRGGEEKAEGAAVGILCMHICM